MCQTGFFCFCTFGSAGFVHTVIFQDRRLDRVGLIDSRLYFLVLQVHHMTVPANGDYQRRDEVEEKQTAELGKKGGLATVEEM